jgi:hypothetical protein
MYVENSSVTFCLLLNNTWLTTVKAFLSVLYCPNYFLLFLSSLEFQESDLNIVTISFPFLNSSLFTELTNISLAYTAELGAT